MYSYSREEFRVEYWVRNQEGSIVRRFNGGALYYARKEAETAQGKVFEVVVDNREGTEQIVSELEI